MKGRTEYIRKLSPVGEVLHMIQSRHKGTPMERDTRMTEVHPKITPTMITEVRYGLRCPTPLFILTVIKTYNPVTALIKALLKAFKEMLSGVKFLRIPKAVAKDNLEASTELAELHEKLSIIGKVKAFIFKWVPILKAMFERFLTGLKNWVSNFTDTMSGRCYTKINLVV